ncbi:hypothetical protein MKW98_028564 [Papaver atlanticum]|uniref:Pirin N-terminal domain-containing protein n=1 Tax=Papaver atlanticum TaxID=357466 RepID=A0AAD4XSI6_9MAGN|nr:hypothetical protein MKW98_028564 [Papaver atlanticum]
MRAIINNHRFLSQLLSRTKTKISSCFLIRSMSSEVNQNFTKSRLVIKKVLAKPQREGEGATVKRSIGRMELKSLDPFLMLDEFSVSPPAGFPDHPHRGFETVTYMLEGAFSHQDFSGHKGTIKTGDVQDRAEVCVIGGQPLNEPVVQYGPFVMNTQAEIDQTFEDYRYSKNGFEKAKYWKSQPLG